MKILKYSLISIAALAAIIFGLLAYSGIFEKAVVKEKIMGPYTMIYEAYVGDYKKSGIVFTRVKNNLAAEGIQTTRGIGIYYDNPANVPADKLRSDCGSIIEDKDYDKLPELVKKFTVKMIAKKECMVIELSARTPLSYVLGPIKAYPKLTEHMKSKSYKTGRTYELYDMPSKIVYYVMEIER